MTNNLALWHLVEKTPPSHTKAITGKPYKGTSPKPHYLVMKATETFGPCGIGWGFSFTERVEQGAAGDRLHIAHVKLWFKWNGERGEVEHIGQTIFSGTRSNGNPFTDEDAPKKSVTDGVIKALSMLGFAGDIFMGRYDDSKYVSELHEEARESAAKANPTAFDMARQKIAAFTEQAALGQWWRESKEGLKATVETDQEYADLIALVKQRGGELAPKTEKEAA